MHHITIDYGMSAYRKVWALQKSLFAEVLNSKKKNKEADYQYLLIGEHPAVYTLGFHGNISNMLATEERLKSIGVECIRIERGGDITFHGPGQVVAYPIINLESMGIGIKGYMDMLEDCIVELLGEYDVVGKKVEDAIGIWVGDGLEERKICAMGVKCSRYVTMHGLALNVNTDLSFFENINPCGFTDRGVTSLQAEIGWGVDVADIKCRLKEIFWRHFTTRQYYILSQGII